jgi:tRNA G10  N-methylase Trm11
LADGFKEYIVNDIDGEKLAMLKHNLKVYQRSPPSLKFINMDFLQVEPFRTDALILCPPWGGI